MATKKALQICMGPSKMDLMLALFDSSARNQRTVSFRIFDYVNKTVVCTILGVDAEDGSGESWNIRGYITDWHGRPRNFTGYYQTGNRAGFLKLTEE